MSGKLVNGESLENKQKERQIYGDTTVLKKCQADKRFAYVGRRRHSQHD
jgi:hypothetical protein